MKARHCALWAACLVGCVALDAVSAFAAQPNIVIILADDLGYGDVHCFNTNGKIATPRLDRLAAEGMRLTDAHSGSAVCSPTRYGVMTGRYSWRSRLQSGVLGGLSPRLIEPDRLTVAQMLKQQGYHTGCIGKWHLGMNWAVLPGKQITELNIEPAGQVHNVDYAQPITKGPNSVGFDSYFGISASLDMVPYTFIRNDRVTVVPSVEKSFPLMFGREERRTRLGPAAPDFEASGVLPRLREEAIRHIEERAAEGKPFFLYLPLASPHTPIAPTKEWQSRSDLNPYADFVMQTDEAVGAVVDTIDRLKLAENTLIIMTSDNGCSRQADFPELLAKGHNPSAQFRGQKADIYEGGHRVPFIARWPGRIKPGSVSAQLTCLTDLMATVAEAVGIALPANAGEDSLSILPVLLDLNEGSRREAIVNHSINGTFAIRERNWKLILGPGSGGWTAPVPGRDDTSAMPAVQLFNLETDIGETTNLQDKHPDRVKRLTELLERYVAEGRSTPGPSQRNTVDPDIRKAGEDAHLPLPARKKAAAKRAS